MIVLHINTTISRISYHKFRKFFSFAQKVETHSSQNNRVSELRDVGGHVSEDVVILQTRVFFLCIFNKINEEEYKKGHVFSMARF